MARISKPGLDYFPLDVNFLQDRKVRRISCRHHAAGIAALTSLLCLIYKEKGYYILWNKDTLFDIAQEACCGEEEMQAIIDDCLSVGLLLRGVFVDFEIEPAARKQQPPSGAGYGAVEEDAVVVRHEERHTRFVVAPRGLFSA